MTKKFRLIYKDKQIINSDYLQEQEGTTTIPDGLQSFECDTVEEMEQYVEVNKLVYVEPDLPDMEKEELEQAKAQKTNELMIYDSSDAVNGFIFAGTQAWFAAATRASLKTSLESAKLLGETEITLLINGLPAKLPIDKAGLLLASIQRYADACFLVTANHAYLISTLKTKEEVEAYDITEGYPEMLNFDVMLK